MGAEKQKAFAVAGASGDTDRELVQGFRATAQTKGAPQGIHIVVNADEVAADDETAWTACVVACESMTNAFGHASCNNGHGVVGVRVRVRVREEQEWVFLTITDNGVGFVPCNGRSIPSNLELSSAIVSEPAGGLGGAVTRKSGPAWTAVTFKVPARRAVQ
jgi:two-component sensor histidine kinase